MRRHSLAVSAAGLFFLLGFAATPIVAQNGPCTSSSSVCVTTWQQDTYRTGQNLQEPTLIATGGNLGTFGELCSAQLDGQVYGQPLVATGVTINNTKYNYVVYVATENDTLYAIDGDPTDGRAQCGIIASLPFLSTGATAGQYQVDCNYVGGGPYSCKNTIGPWIGILGTPVIVTNGTTGTIYLVTETQDVPIGQKPANWYHYLHAVDIQTMQEIVPAVRIAPPVGQDASHFSASHIQRTGLLYLTASQARLNDPMIYIGFSMIDGAGTPNPSGYFFSYDATTLAYQGYFQTSKGVRGADGGGIWMGGGAPAYGLDKNGNGWIYLTTANGVFNIGPDGNNYGDSLLMLDPSTLTVPSPNNGFGYFTPADQYYREAYYDNTCSTIGGGDVDFGSGSVLLIPDNTLANFGFLAVNGDKEGGLWFTDRTNPNGYNAAACGNICPCEKLGGNNIQTFWTGSPFGGRAIHNGAAFWHRPASATQPATPYLFVVPSEGMLTQYPLCSGPTANTPICNGQEIVVGHPQPHGSPILFNYGATPAISAASPSATDAIIWTAVGSKDPQPTVPPNGFGGTFLAFDALSLTELYSNHTCKTRDMMMPNAKFSIPTVANGNVYLGTFAVDSNGNSIPNGALYIFGMNAAPCTDQSKATKKPAA